MVKQISDNEIYLLIKYIKSVLWRVAKRLSYIEEAWCLKVNLLFVLSLHIMGFVVSVDLQHRICSIRAMKDTKMQRTLLEKKDRPAIRYSLFLDNYDN